MSGLAAQLPLTRDPDDGIRLIRDFRQLARQNLTNLLFTIEGERIMNPSFGVGLKKYLFENDTIALRSELSSRIRSQVSRYIPYINIINLSFKSSVNNKEIDGNTLLISIEYNISPLNLLDILTVSRSNTNIATF